MRGRQSKRRKRDMYGEIERLEDRAKQSTIYRVREGTRERARDLEIERERLEDSAKKRAWKKDRASKSELE